MDAIDLSVVDRSMFHWLCNAMGWVVSFICKALIVQNRLIITAISLLSCALFVYVNWVVWLNVQFDIEVRNPFEILSIIQMLAVEGVWEIFGSVPTGWGLYTFWLLEVVVIIGATLLAAFKHLVYPFCYACSTYTENRIRVNGLQHISNELGYKEEFERTGLPLLYQLQPGNDPADFTSIDLIKCCENLICGRVQRTKITVDEDNGKVSTEDTTIAPLFFITDQEYKELQNHFQNFI